MTIDTRKKFKIYPSSSGFVHGRGVIAEYSSACMRYILVAPHAPWKPIDPLYGEVGAHHEDAYAAEIETDLKYREFVMKEQLTPDIEYSGRCDFVTKDGVVHETKASMSKNFLYGVINKGAFKTSHLAQLVSYLIQLKQTMGKIVAGYYEKTEEGDWIQKGRRDFKVGIGETGTIFVDGEATDYTVHDQLGHRNLAVEVLTKQVIHDRPLNADAGFSSPCNYCPMRPVCDKHDDTPMGTPEFIKAGVEAIAGSTGPVAKVNIDKPRKRIKKEKV